MPCTGIYDNLVETVTQNYHYVKQGVLHSKGATGGDGDTRRQSPLSAPACRRSVAVASGGLPARTQRMAVPAQ